MLMMPSLVSIVAVYCLFGSIVIGGGAGYCLAMRAPSLRPQALTLASPLSSGIIASQAMADDSYPKIGHFKDISAFAEHLRLSGLDLPCDQRVLSAAEGSPLAQPLDVGGFV